MHKNKNHTAAEFILTNLDYNECTMQFFQNCIQLNASLFTLNWLFFDVTVHTQSHVYRYFNFQAVPYTKTCSNSSLRIKFNALMSVRFADDTKEYCGRW